MKNLRDFPQKATLFCRGGSVRALAGIALAIEGIQQQN